MKRPSFNFDLTIGPLSLKSGVPRPTYLAVSFNLRWRPKHGFRIAGVPRCCELAKVHIRVLQRR